MITFGLPGLSILCMTCVFVVPALADVVPKGSQSASSGMVYVRMETTLGGFVLELNHDKAPVTVDNFMAYVDEKFYDGLVFHRIIKDFMIQGGGMTPDGTRKETKDPIKNEADNGLKNDYGTIAMARTANPHSATSQFFINVVNNGNLNYTDQRRGWGYCVFGKVIDGLDAIEKIRNVPVQAPSVPETPVIINKAVRVDPAELKDVIKAARDKAAEAEKAKQAAMVKAIEQAVSFIAGRKVDTSGGKFTDSGLWVLHVKEGTGQTPTLTDSVKAHYRGWLTDGSEFDASYARGAPSRFKVSGVIKGWTEALGMMKVGGKSYLIIPPELGYGARGSAKIPANSTLIFEIELMEIVK